MAAAGPAPLWASCSLLLRIATKRSPIQPNDAATLNSRGLIYLKLGQLDSAINDYSSALRIEPALATALYGRGLARIKKGDATGGKADLAAAAKLERKIAENFSQYGIQ